MIAKPDAWSRRDDDSVDIKPILGFACTPLSNGLLAIRIEYADSPDHAKEVVAGTSIQSFVQLGVAPDQAKRIAAILEEASTKLIAISSGDGRPN